MATLVSALGVGLALLAAFAWAVQYLALRLGTDGGSIRELMVVTLCCNVAIAVPVVVVFFEPTVELTSRSLGAFAAAGIVGSLFGRLLLYGSVDTVGASRTAPVVASSTLFATGFAIPLLGERLSVAHAVGVVLVVAGISVVSWETTADADGQRSLRAVGRAIVLPLGSAVLLGLEPVFVAWGLAEGTPAVTGFAVTAVVASVGLLGFLLARGDVPTRRLLRHPNRLWYAVSGLASTAGLLTYFFALDVAPVSVVVPVSQISPLLVVVLSALFLPRRLERVTWRLGAAACVVVVGTVIVSTAT